VKIGDLVKIKGEKNPGVIIDRYQKSPGFPRGYIVMIHGELKNYQRYEITKTWRESEKR